MTIDVTGEGSTDAADLTSDSLAPTKSSARDKPMTLIDHLRELRSRLFKSALAIVIGAVIGWAYYDPIFSFVTRPFTDAVKDLGRDPATTALNIDGITTAFTLKVKVALTAGVVLSAPVWLWQLWRFIAPGLKGAERKWTYFFAFTATPLFLAGIATAYLILSGAMAVLIGLTPTGLSNINRVDDYLNFILQVGLFFGIGFVIPLVFVTLNFAGILSAARLLSWWRGLIFGCFLFAAVATPTGEPITMLLTALPFLALVGLAIGVCAVNDRMRSRRQARAGQWADDEISPIEPVAPVAPATPVAPAAPISPVEPITDFETPMAIPTMGSLRPRPPSASSAVDDMT